MNSRELVYRTLAFKNIDKRVPRQLWILPWAADHYPDMLQTIAKDFPDDIGNVNAPLRQPLQTQGDPYAVGEYIDEWGCRFTNIHKGIIGEVKEPIVPADDFLWETAHKILTPEEHLTFDMDEVNKNISNSELFIISGSCPRPFEQLQFIRGTENLYMDIMDPPPLMIEFIKRMHDFYCRWTLAWAKTDVDALMMMDDWGSQNSLLINPKIWSQIFKPMYKDYIDIAHSHGKKIFMHSDGYILDIIPHLIEMGLDAINCQIFCMGVENLASYKGQITFWGEIDRQHLLPDGSLEDIRQAVRSVMDNLWDNGGCIAQMEFGPGAKPENVYEVFKTFDKLKV